MPQREGSEDRPRVPGAPQHLAVDVHGIAKQFGHVIALQGLSFQAEPREVIGLLGPNGAGKTTAIRILSTIIPASGGSFSLDGIPGTSPALIRRRIGVLPESAGYPLAWSGEEFLRYHARLFGHSADSAREVSQSLLSRVGLRDRGPSPISTYSRGMRQRLGVARAMVNDPAVLFLDEPTLGLDPAGQREILSLIREVARERGVTVVLSTHFLDEVEEVCTRALILNRGEMVVEGTIAEIKRRAAPKNARIQVQPDMQRTALAVVAAAPGVLRAQDSGMGEGGQLIAAFDPEWLDRHGDGGMNAALRALVEAEIPVVAFELEGGRLSDAFLALTGEVTQ